MVIQLEHRLHVLHRPPCLQQRPAAGEDRPDAVHHEGHQPLGADAYQLHPSHLEQHARRVAQRHDPRGHLDAQQLPILEHVERSERPHHQLRALGL